MELAKYIGAVLLALQESLLREDLSRVPEPFSEMNVQDQIEGFHEAGSNSLLPIYHFNARAISALAPRGAHVVDLGSGSAQFLCYLAVCRPDLQITGVDLSLGMLNVGRATLAKRGLADRVKLRAGDMRHFRDIIDTKIDMITSVFSLHHLQMYDDLVACVGEIKKAIAADGAQLWIFDFARPRRQSTSRRFADIFTPDGSPTFKRDTRNSLQASWSFEEIQSALNVFFSGQANSSLARGLRLYQFHYLDHERTNSHEMLWSDAAAVPLSALKDAERLAGLFLSPPGQKYR